MTVIAFDDGAIYADQCFVEYMAGVAAVRVNPKLFTDPNHRFAYVMSGNQLSPTSQRVVMQLIETMLKLIYAADDGDPYPKMGELHRFLTERKIYVITRDRVFDLAAPKLMPKGSKHIDIIELHPNARNANGNCAPFYLVDRALGLTPVEAVKSAVRWKMGKDTKVDWVHMGDLEPMSASLGDTATEEVTHG